MTAKNRTLIKLDDKIIEITQGKKGLIAKELSEEDLCEVTLLDEGVEKLIENDINRLTNEAYSELTLGFKASLKENVLKIAGFSNGWGRWEVDHCNGRSSIMTDYISSKVRSTITTELDKMLQPDIEKALEPIKSALIKEYKEEYSCAVRDQMRSQCENAAKAFVSSVMTKQIAKHQKKALEKAEETFLGRKVRRSDEGLDEN